MKHRPNRILIATGVLLGLAVGWHQRTALVPAAPAPTAAAIAAVTPPSPDTNGSATPPASRPRHIAGAAVQPPAADPALARFEAWAQRYLALPADQRASLVEEGRALAAARRAVLAQMIRTDPRAALDSAVPMVVRQQLPPEILALLEDRVSGRGELALLGVTPVPGQSVPEATFRKAMVNGEEYRAYVFGRRQVAATVGRTSMNGIALDGHFAVAEMPLRVLEPGELAAGRPVNGICDVSGASSPAGVDTPFNLSGDATAPMAVEYDGTIHVLCGANHLAATKERLLAREESAAERAGANGPGSSGVQGRPAATWTHGAKKVLVIRVDFSDRPGAPQTVSGTTITDDYAATIMTPVQTFFAENSFGKTSLAFAPAAGGDSPDVTPVLRMPQTFSYYAGNGTDRSGTLHVDARAAAQAAGINVQGYDRIGVVHSYTGNYWWAGLAEIGGKNFWINGYFDFRIVTHEIGHNYGMMHANTWRAPSNDPTSLSGTSIEYGDATDVMGGGDGLPHHFSHWNKSIMQWIPDTAVTTVAAAGTYRVHRLDAGSANLALPRALKLKFDAQRDFWIGYRPAVGLGTTTNGAYVLWGYNYNQQGNVLNVSRSTSGSSYDAPLAIGQTFVDSASAVSLRTVAQGGSGADQWLDVEVQFLPSIRWSQTADYVAGEQEGFATLRLVRTGDPAAAVSVSYSTGDQTATAGADYTALTGTVAWAAGDAADKTISIPVTSDTITEGGERFTVTLSSASGAMIAGSPGAVVNIIDRDVRDFSFMTDPIWDRVEKALVLPDGSVIIGGWFRQIVDSDSTMHYVGGLAKLTPEGRLVPGFAGDGVMGEGARVYDLARQADGKILVAGSFRFMDGELHPNLLRLNADGSLDTGFNASADQEVSCVVPLPNGKILIGGLFTVVNGTPRVGVARLNADGSLDSSFVGPNFDAGLTQVHAIAPYGWGGALLAGHFALTNGSARRSGVCRVGENGALDATFDVGHGAHEDGNPAMRYPVRALALQADGRVLIAGSFSAFNGTTRRGFARLTSSGAVDPTFNVSSNGYGTAIMPMPDGRIIVGGVFTQLGGVANTGIGIILPDGTVNSYFASIGGFNGEVTDLTLLPNGRVQFCGAMQPFQHTQEWRPVWRFMSGLERAPGRVQFTASTATVDEGGLVQLTIARTGGSGAARVGYASMHGTTSDADFPRVLGEVFWADGDTSTRTIGVQTATDSQAEADETFYVSLGVPTSHGVNFGPTQRVTVTLRSTSEPPPPPPGGWQAGDIGAVGAAGSSSESGGVVTLRGAGADIWGTADAFQFRHQQLAGDGAIIVRVASTGNTHPWAKVGIMFRENLTPGSREVMAFVTPGNHSGLQYRLEPGATSAMGADLWSGIPVWLMLVRAGDTFGGYRSYDGENWTPLGTINCNLPDTAYVGLAVSSHVAGTLLTATFDNVELTGTEPPPPGEPPAAPSQLATGGVTASTVGLTWQDNASDETGFAIERATGASGPFAEVDRVAANSRAFTDSGLSANTTYVYRVRAYRGTNFSAYSNTVLVTTGNPPPGGWTGIDIGNVGPAGSESVADPNLTVRAGGADIWGAADGFRYVYRPWTGDGEIRVRVARLDNTHAWAKAGVMFREDLSAGSRNVAYVLTAANTSGLQARATAGGETTFTNGPWVNAPYWVRLVRAGNTFTAYTSPDGFTWTVRGTQTITMGTNIHVGVATSSHTTTALTTAIFENVQLPDAPPPPPPPPPPGTWTRTTFGAASGSFTTPEDNAVTVTGTGADIWGPADDAQFVHRPWSGDGEIVARIDSFTNTHPWAKAGLMLRESLDASARNVFVGLTPTNGVAFQVRATPGGLTTEVQHNWLPGAPCWLKLTRAGDTFTAAFSTNGTAWTPLGSTTLALPGSLHVGLGVSSHASAATTAVFKNIQVPDAPPPPPPPGSWAQTSWGTAGGSFTKTDTSTGATIDVTSTGADIWGQADDGLFVHPGTWGGERGAGDKVITVRVESMTNTHPWAKAGIMFRDTLAAGSPNVFFALTPGVGVTLQVRTASGGVTTEAHHSWAPGVPCWLRLSRHFNGTFTARFSADGVNWTVLGTVTDPLLPNTEIYGGIATSSHATATMSVRFSAVELIRLI